MSRAGNALHNPPVPRALPAELRAAYHATDYVVLADAPGATGAPDAPDTPPVAVLRAGALAPAEAWRLAPRARSLVVVTAWNPFSEKQDDAVNAQRHAWLVREVERACLRHWPAEGRSRSGDWPPEASLLVADASAVQMDRWLRGAGQYALIEARPAQPARLRVHPELRRRERMQGGGEPVPVLQFAG